MGSISAYTYILIFYWRLKAKSDIDLSLVSTTLAVRLNSNICLPVTKQPLVSTTQRYTAGNNHTGHQHWVVNIFASFLNRSKWGYYDWHRSGRNWSMVKKPEASWHCSFKNWRKILSRAKWGKPAGNTPPPPSPLAVLASASTPGVNGPCQFVPFYRMRKTNDFFFWEF